MANVLDCKDMGIDCPARIRGDNPEEVMNKAIEHGRKEHGIKEVSPEMKDKLRRAIKEER